MTRNPTHNRFLKILKTCVKLLPYLFIVLCLQTLYFNTRNLKKDITKIRERREVSPYISLGSQFSGLKDILKDVQYVGYYTDKNLDDNSAAAQFSQAQYELAPVILDLNNVEHKYVIFDCSTRKIEDHKIAEMGMIPIRRNTLGPITLTKNPYFQEEQTD